MSTFIRRQFSRTLTASVGSVWARDVAWNKAFQANQQQTWARSITDVPGIKAGHYTDSRGGPYAAFLESPLVLSAHLRSLRSLHASVS